jgi:hypothetical protein
MPGYAAIAAEKSVTISSFVHIAESEYKASRFQPVIEYEDEDDILFCSSYASSSSFSGVVQYCN